MKRRLASSAWVAVLFCLVPAIAGAQGDAVQAPANAPGSSRLWLVVGGASTTLLGDCADCTADNYRHSGSFTASLGRAINPRANLGGELTWAPVTLSTGDPVRVTFLLASVQFKPWQRKGFLLKAGSGMAFLTNWLNIIDETSPRIRSKAFALALGTGWEWPVSQRLGMQVFAAQHVAALGDLQTDVRTAENVVGNFWSVGGAIVIR
jgi:hypothetical protein